MSTEEIVKILAAERDRLSRAIEALQGPIKRRGRPSKSAKETVAAKPPAPKKRTFTAAQKKAQSEKMKAYWKIRQAK
jgi:hypothetical protein